MYSGVDEHVSISRAFGNHTLTFLMFDLKLPGIAYGFAFCQKRTACRDDG